MLTVHVNETDTLLHHVTDLDSSVLPVLRFMTLKGKCTKSRNEVKIAE